MIPPTFSIPYSWTKTFINFTPKIKNLTMVAYYQPIALSNISYHILAKILSNRTKPYIQHLINLHQSTFLSNQSIYNNILIA